MTLLWQTRTKNRFESHDDEFDINDKSTWPAVIIATSIDAGMEYVKILGIKNFIVTDSVNVTQGLRCRAVIPTPGYLQKMDMIPDHRAAYDGAIQSFAMASLPWG